MKIRCVECNKRLARNRPKLYCTICHEIKHFSCQDMSKNDAKHIITIKLQWTCPACIREILPINACRAAKQSQSDKFKIQCLACLGYCYSPNNVRTCNWCECSVHKKCFKDSLGCVKCCEENIPGYYTTSYELNEDYNRLENLIYNPYDREHFVNMIGDAIVNEEHHNTLWGDVSDFLVKCKYQQPGHVKPPKTNELKIFSSNIRNLIKKIPDLRENIAIYDNFDIIALNETNLIFDKLPNGIQDITLDGFFDPIVQDPISNKGGGLAIYIHKRVVENEDDIDKKYHPNPDPQNTSGEFQFVKIHKCKGFQQTKIIANVYRSPSRKAEAFNKLLESVLHKIERHSKKHCHIAGDFNMDLLKHDNVTDYQDLINIMVKHNFVQIVSRPTRITDTSATLIDHVYTNNLESTVNCNILTTCLSDHLSTVTTLNLGNTRENNQNARLLIHDNTLPDREYRIFNEANDQKFKNLVDEENWSSILKECHEAQLQFDKFHGRYTELYNEAYPLKKDRVRRKNERVNPKPWILPWLEDAIARKETLFHERVKRPTTENINAFKKMEKFCEKHKKIAQERYYKKYFEQYKNNSKKQWQIMNSLLGRKIYRKESIRLKDCNGNILSNSNDVSENFNNYFTQIASNLKAANSSNKIFDPGGFHEFLRNPTENSMYLKPAEVDEVHKIIKNFQDKATLDSKIGPLKVANQNYLFTDTLIKIINNSYIQGIFPKALKIAKVVPIHKDGPRDNVENYRPISLLSSFSKIYEKVMHNRVIEFLDQNGTLYEMQYGFRPGRSCEHALLNAKNTILNSLSKREVTLLLLIDFSKAFDMIEHPILLKKLEHYGIRGVVLEWFKSYLCNREQYVTINGTNSTYKAIEFGVPQGSILGPLLFIIYINDLPGITQFAKFILYADDANVLISGKNLVEVLSKFESISSTLVKWVGTNGLSLNLKKTKYMLFSNTNEKITNGLNIGGTLIEQTTEARFLGVIVDEKLNWSKHIATVKAKMSRYVGIMCKIKRNLPLQARIQIYHSMVQSHLNYCSIVWGFASKTHIESLFRCQKKGIRAIMPYAKYFYKDGRTPTHTKSSFNEYGILSVHGIVMKNTFLFMHKVNYFPSLLPSSIISTIPENAPDASATHETSCSWLNIYGNPVFRSSVFYKGPLLSITERNIKITTPGSISSFNLYKTKLIDMLLKLQNEGETEEWPNFLLYCVPGLRKSTRNVSKQQFDNSS